MIYFPGTFLRTQIEQRQFGFDCGIGTPKTFRPFFAVQIFEYFNIPKENIQILAVIDLPDLGGSVIIKDSGYNVKTLIEFEGE